MLSLVPNNRSALGALPGKAVMVGGVDGADDWRTSVVSSLPTCIPGDPEDNGTQENAFRRPLASLYNAAVPFTAHLPCIPGDVDPTPTQSLLSIFRPPHDQMCGAPHRMQPNGITHELPNPQSPAPQILLLRRHQLVPLDVFDNSQAARPVLCVCVPDAALEKVYLFVGGMEGKEGSTRSSEGEEGIWKSKAFVSCCCFVGKAVTVGHTTFHLCAHARACVFSGLFHSHTILILPVDSVVL